MNKDRNIPFIYESPDNGKTVYRRRFGDITTEEKVPTDEDLRLQRIWERNAALAAEMLEWEKEWHKEWGPPWDVEVSSPDEDAAYNLGV